MPIAQSSSPKRSLARVALWTLLATSLAANLLLGWLVHDSFAKLQYLRLFPLGYSQEDPRKPEGSSTHASVALWGDSRAYGWDKGPLESMQWTVLNFAHGGQTSSQLLLQLQTQPVVQTDYAVVQIGINDLHPLGALPQHKGQILERLRSNILEIRDQLLGRSGVVVLTTIIPPGPVAFYRQPTWDPSTMQHVIEVNDLIRRAARMPRVVLLDADALLRGRTAWLDERYADDHFFLHVNQEAYERLNSELLKMLAQHPPRHN